jgi:rod shape-determining protein MreD
VKGFARALGALALAVAATVTSGALFPGSRQGVDFFLLIVVHYAITRPRMTGLLTGAAVGLVQDGFRGQLLGYQAFVKTGVALAVGGLGARFMLTQPFPRLLALLLATVADIAISTVLSLATGLPRPMDPAEAGWRLLLQPPLGLAIYTLIGRPRDQDRRLAAARGRR